MADAAASKSALSPEEFRQCTLKERRQHNHDSVSLRFAFKDEQATAGLPVASCILLQAHIGEKGSNGEPESIIRPYTPISEPDSKGGFDLVVKVYPNGNMSKHLGEMAIGESIGVKGPISKIEYRPNMHKHLAMIAGGSGLTPMLQVVEEVLRREEDQTQVTLIYANKTPEDILMRSRLDDLADRHDQFQVIYTVTDPGDSGNWAGLTGFVDAKVCRTYLTGPDEDVLVLVCGPPPMMKAVSGDKAEDKSQGELEGALAEVGYSKDQVFKF